MKDDAAIARLLDPESLLKQQLGVKLGHQVADLGCGGAGYFTLPAARVVGSRGRVYAVDILRSALDGVVSKAKLSNLSNVEPVWSDLERVGAAKVPESSLDEALLVNIMFQSRQNEAMLREAHRLLKTGGRLLVVDWKVEPTPFGPPLERRLTPENISQLASAIGFTLENKFDSGPYHYGLIFLKT
jgi:ubiquinone/menaquinone biosynthesis C-methylase UbiE